MGLYLNYCTELIHSFKKVDCENSGQIPRVMTYNCRWWSSRPVIGRFQVRSQKVTSQSVVEQDTELQMLLMSVCELLTHREVVTMGVRKSLSGQRDWKDATLR